MDNIRFYRFNYEGFVNGHIDIQLHNTHITIKKSGRERTWKVKTDVGLTYKFQKTQINVESVKDFAEFIRNANRRDSPLNKFFFITLTKAFEI